MKDCNNITIKQCADITVYNDWANITNKENGYIISASYMTYSLLVIKDFDDELGIDVFYTYDIMDITDEVVTIFGINGSYGIYESWTKLMDWLIIS